MRGLPHQTSEPSSKQNPSASFLESRILASLYPSLSASPVALNWSMSNQLKHDKSVIELRKNSVPRELENWQSNLKLTSSSLRLLSYNLLAAGNRGIRSLRTVCITAHASGIRRVPLSFESTAGNQLYQSRCYHRQIKKDRGSFPSWQLHLQEQKQFSSRDYKAQQSLQLGNLLVMPRLYSRLTFL